MSSGNPTVGDSFAILTGGRAADGELRRHPESFFQANRFLLPSIVSHVLDAVPPDGEVLDLYAGVGLFALALAARGQRGVTAVEGEPSSGRDLRRNTLPFGDAVRVVLGSVEGYVAGSRARPATVVVDPPRTGISKEAMRAVARLGAARVVYVSCDPATMARDARRLVDAGYAVASLRGFDLFPNTPHVETLGVFVRN
jgi:23S rRNA (uracil1939-C5)-methyltransferase